MAARIAWFAENIRVTFVWIPASFNFLTAFKPSGIIGILTTTFGPYFLSLWASSIISAVVVPTTSRLTGPLTILTIWRIMSAGLPFSFDSRVGLVVMPSTNPISLYFLIDSMLAVSRKIFIISCSYSLLQAPPLLFLLRSARTSRAACLFLRHGQTRQTYRARPRV